MTITDVPITTLPAEGEVGVLDVGPLTTEDHEELAALTPVERSAKLQLRYGSDASRLAHPGYAAEAAS